MKYRQAAVAGSFYPDSAAQIKQQLATYLSLQNPPQIQCTSQVKALIVPHAGYCYSGAVAGHAYVYLQNIFSKIKRVILLGPSHRVPLIGCAISSCDFFITPLGKIPVDQKLNAQLLARELLITSDQAHLLEHSLEVQLPFLQTCLADFTLIPIVVGQCSAKHVYEILNQLQVNEPTTLVVVSSDLSHFHPYHEARRLDDMTIQHILNYDAHLDGSEACGCYAVNGLLSYAKSQHWQIKLVNKANSADAVGSKREVVGYASFILY